tara:strand:- start:6597 stop:7511 length:915 start_codon:yes stop_codon:yes gene_type:complete
MKKIIFLISVIFLFINCVYSQIDSDYKFDKGTKYVEGQKYVFEFRDGTITIGTYLRTGEGNIYIKDLSGEDIYIPKIMIAQIHLATDDNVKGDEFWFSNLHDTRYFFSPTAFGLEPGEGYYHHSYWLLWQAQWGVTENFSLGGGTSLFGIPSSLNAKFNGKISSSVNGAFGWFWVGDLFGVSGESLYTLVNMPYGVLTFGNREQNVTFGTGVNFAGEWSGNNPLVLNFGATFRTSRRFAFIAEGWVFQPGSDANFLGGPGIRYFRKVNRVTAKNGAGASTWDIQFLINPDMEGIIPVFGASRKF